MSLFDFVESVYNSLFGYNAPSKENSIINPKAFRDLINDDTACLELINSILEFDDAKPILNKERASHIIVTWLLGFGIDIKAFKIKSADGFQTAFYQSLWTHTALIHDYGYFRKEIRDRETTIDNLQDKYKLLTDYYEDDFLKCLNGFETSPETHSIMTYDYMTISRYFEYIKYRNLTSDEEKCDHGIVGGCLGFRKYCESIARAKGINPSDRLTRIYKSACLVTASHNVFKSSDKRCDQVYVEFGLNQITSDKQACITRENKLLYILSIVDTIECTKRFSRRNDSANYLEQRTVLQNVDIVAEENQVTVDYSKLYSYLVKKRKNDYMANNLVQHIEDVRALSSWVNCETETVEGNEYAIIIRA